MSRRLCRICLSVFVGLPLLVSTCADTLKLKAWTRQVCEANSDKVLRAINDTDSFGTTPLMIACFHGHLDVALHLLSRRAAPNAANNRGRTALFHSLSPPPKPLPGLPSEGTYSQSFERTRVVARSLVAALLQHQADACHMDHNGITPLRLAAVRHPPRHPLPADCVRVPRVCLEIPAAPSGLHAMTFVGMLARTVMPACACAVLALWVGEGVSCRRTCIDLRRHRR